ncbi:MAG: NUDIX domain-containing protein [Planctomycetota bacterium]
MQYGRVLLVRRAETGLLGGLWTLPAAVVADGQSHADVLRAHVRGALGLDLRVGRRLALVRHDFTHRRLHVAVYAAKPDNDPPPCSASKADAQCGFGWVHPREFPRYPLATLDRKLLEAAALHRGPRHTPPPAPPPRRGALPSPGSRRPHRQITMNLKLIAPPR